MSEALCWQGEPAGWSASPLPSSRRAVRAGRSRGPDDGSGLLRVLWGHAGVAVCAGIGKWGTSGERMRDWPERSQTSGLQC